MKLRYSPHYINLTTAKISDNICPKCSGSMYVNEDRDLNCRMCGTIIVLTVRRAYDSRTGKIRDNKKEARGGNVDGDIEVDRGRIRNSDSINACCGCGPSADLFSVGDIMVETPLTAF